jgi:SAM-dependent methyltransferase
MWKGGNMKKPYDDIIDKHYEEEAEKQGLSLKSTMADEIVREIETKTIICFIKESLKGLRKEGLTEPALILDVGCGNGYTLEKIINLYPDERYIGIEKSDKLRSLARNRFLNINNIKIMAGDIRYNNFMEKNSVDILICQRVIINLLDIEDQIIALNNIINVVSSKRLNNKSGRLIFIEAFKTPLENLNLARREFNLPPINEPYHNLYLPDDFFKTSHIKPIAGYENLPPPNLFSTHYFVSRVFHPFLIRDKEFKRNSEFVKFFTNALKQYVGDYSPLKLYTFEKV